MSIQFDAPTLQSALSFRFYSTNAGNRTKLVPLCTANNPTIAICDQLFYRNCILCGNSKMSDEEFEVLSDQLSSSVHPVICSKEGCATKLAELIASSRNHSETYRVLTGQPNSTS